jgi:hypothetical protein
LTLAHGDQIGKDVVATGVLGRDAGGVDLHQRRSRRSPSRTPAAGCGLEIGPM